MLFEGDNVIEVYSEQYLPMCLGMGVGSRVSNVERQMSLWIDLNVQLNGSVGCLISVSLSKLSVEREPGGEDSSPSDRYHGSASGRTLDLSPWLRGTAPIGPLAAVSQGVCIFYRIWNEEFPVGF